MDNGKKKYLEQNPASRGLLFKEICVQISECTEAICALSRAQKTGLDLTVNLRGGRIVIGFGAGVVSSGNLTGVKELAEFFVCRRLMLFGERNEWLEAWPSLVDLLELEDLAPFPIPGAQIASNESTGP